MCKRLPGPLLLLSWWPGIITEALILPKGTAGQRGRDGSWSPRAPSQPPFLPWAPKATAAGTLPPQPSALQTSRWGLGAPSPRCCLGHCPKSVRSRPRSTFFLWQLHDESLLIRLRGASLTPSLMLLATPSPILPGPSPASSVSLPPPFLKALLTLGIH